MAGSDIMEYVRNNAGNRSQLLADVVEGPSYLHKVSIVHGGLKGANILIESTGSARLADFGLATVVHGPGLEVGSLKSVVAGGTTSSMAPELLFPSRFDLEKCAPTKGADVYAMAMAIHQVPTGSLSDGKLGGSEVIFKNLGGQKPLKPANAIKLGLSEVWGLPERCRETDSASRPSVKDVSACVKSAASTCGILSPAGCTPQRHEDPDPDLFNLGCYPCCETELHHYIPQRRYIPTQGAREATFTPVRISFRKASKCGILVRDAISKDFRGFEGRDTRPFQGVHNADQVTLKIEWPGYPPWSSVFRTRGHTPAKKPVILSGLAFEVCRRIEKFVEDMEEGGGITGIVPI